jgi:hypothetical protein
VNPTRQICSPATLVAIVRAAHLTGDRDLERAARQRLREEFGMRVVIEHRRKIRQEGSTR